MEMTQFFLKWKDKYLDFDGGLGNQCVDVIKAYFKDVLEKEPLAGNAIDYWRDIPGFTRISKTLFNRPNPGDIIVWNTGEFGHIAICNWSRFFDVGVFEQNNPIDSPCHYGTHDYKGILGWLRPKRKLNVVLVNPPTDFLKEKLEFYAGKFNFTDKTYPISVPEGLLTGDQAVEIIDKLQKADVYLIFCPGNPTATFEVASYYPSRNCAFATIPTPNPTTIPVHAMIHCLRKYINFNHLGPYIEDVERYPTSWADSANFDNPGWRFEEQYNEIKKYL